MQNWGYAPEYCEGMWRILQQEKAEDFVLATGETHTVREFTEVAFNELGIELEWQGENEKGIVKAIKNEKLKILKENFHNVISTPTQSHRRQLKGFKTF